MSALLFWRAKLYSDSTLQGIFFVLGCYGWWRWQTKGNAGEVLRVRRTRAIEWKVLSGLVVFVTAGLASWLAHATDSPAPLADALVLTLSLAATWGQAEKLVESWWIWIAVEQTFSAISEANSLAIDASFRHGRPASRSTRAKCMTFSASFMFVGVATPSRWPSPASGRGNRKI